MSEYGKDFERNIQKYGNFLILPAESYIMLGKVSLSMCVISVIVHVIIVGVLALVAAKIYVSLILYTGKKMSIKQLWSVVFRKKEGDICA